MFSPDSAATVDMIADYGIGIVAERGFDALSAAAVAARGRCTRHAVQQWCQGRPLRILFAERFVARWIRWTGVRTGIGRHLVWLLPENDDTLEWTRVWLALLEASPRDQQLANLVAHVLAHERCLVAAAVPPEEATRVYALVSGLRQARCVAQPPLAALEAEAILTAAVDRA